MLAIRCGDRFVLSGKLICDAIKQMRDGAALAAKQLTASGPFTPAPDVRGDTDHNPPPPMTPFPTPIKK